MIKREATEVYYEIKKEHQRFDREFFIKGVKDDIKNLYYELKENRWDSKKLNCNDDLLEKIKSNKELYRIETKYDTIAVQYADLYDFIIGEKTNIIKIYTSLYFFDNVKNNENTMSLKNKYFNDIWIVSYESSCSKIKEDILKCKQCGANMIKNERENIIRCEYCQSEVFYNFGINNWKIADIEVIR